MSQNEQILPTTNVQESNQYKSFGIEEGEMTNQNNVEMQTHLQQKIMDERCQSAQSQGNEQNHPEINRIMTMIDKIAGQEVGKDEEEHKVCNQGESQDPNSHNICNEGYQAVNCSDQANNFVPEQQLNQTEEVKVYDEGYNEDQSQTNYQETNQPDNRVQGEAIVQENKHDNVADTQTLDVPPSPSVESTASTCFNSYTQSVLNMPLNPFAEPTHTSLQQIYNSLKTQFPQCLPQQIILLLYNNLIKIPRQEMMEEQGETFDDNMIYDGGQKYYNEISSANNKSEFNNFDLRKVMIDVYVTKGYGLKVYQEHIQKINPNAQPIDKEKFKAHFVNIYKIIVKKVQDFLANTADRQFQPMTKNQFHKTLGDVVNCRKHYSQQFCEVFFRILQSTFSIPIQKIPNEREVVFFYRTILSKVRQSKIILARKLHQIQQQKNPDIWTEEFQSQIIKLFIKQKNLLSVKLKLIELYPEYEDIITQIKLAEKIQNAIRIATRHLSIQNQQCRNSVSFAPNDVDRRFIMKAPELEESRIKLLKVYLKKPTDPQILGDTVRFIHGQLSQKYSKEQIPQEAISNSTIKLMPRSEQQRGLQNLIKAQLSRTA